MLVHRRVTPPSPPTFIHLGAEIEALWEYSVLPKNTTQCPTRSGDERTNHEAPRLDKKTTSNTANSRSILCSYKIISNVMSWWYFTNKPRMVKIGKDWGRLGGTNFKIRALIMLAEFTLRWPNTVFKSLCLILHNFQTTYALAPIFCKSQD